MSTQTAFDYPIIVNTKKIRVPVAPLRAASLYASNIGYHPLEAVRAAYASDSDTCEVFETAYKGLLASVDFSQVAIEDRIALFTALGKTSPEKL